MSDQYNVVVPIDTKNGTYWHRVGTMFKAKRGYTILLNSVPSPQKNYDNDQFGWRLMAFEPQEDKRSNDAPPAKLDDEIPY